MQAGIFRDAFRSESPGEPIAAAGIENDELLDQPAPLRLLAGKPHQQLGYLGNLDDLNSLISRERPIEAMPEGRNAEPFIRDR